MTIGGAKNAALGILAAAIMADETVVIDNLPNVRDINVLLTAIESIGATVKRIGPHVVSINGSTINDMTIDYDSIRKIRASYYLLGALLGKYKKAQVALPGGCEIGSRPIDLHLKGFRALGATVSIEHGMINTSADELVGNHIFWILFLLVLRLTLCWLPVWQRAKQLLKMLPKNHISLM